jgi:hypothetical protein
MRGVIVVSFLLSAYSQTRFITLHIPGGGFVELSPDKVVTMREPAIEGHINKNVHCLVTTDDGKFIGVAETCEDVRTKIESNVPAR